MRCRVEVSHKKVAVVFPFGSYNADFKRNTVEFYKGSVGLCSPQVYLNMEIDEEHLEPKEGFDGVKHYFDRINIESFDYIVEIEYLDITEGHIGEHTHPAGVEEVYFTMTEPYCGAICLDGESHRPWAKKMFAVKILPR